VRRPRARAPARAGARAPHERLVLRDELKGARAPLFLDLAQAHVHEGGGHVARVARAQGGALQLLRGEGGVSARACARACARARARAATAPRGARRTAISKKTDFSTREKWSFCRLKSSSASSAADSGGGARAGAGAGAGGGEGAGFGLDAREPIVSECV